MDDFTIHTEGRFVSKGLWQIDARLRLRDGVHTKPGDLLLGKARLALFQAVLGEAARGHLHGAATVWLRVDDLGQAYEVDLGELIRDGGHWH